MSNTFASNCDNSRRLLIQECVSMDLTDGEFYFSQDVFEELTSNHDGVASQEPFAIHARNCVSCQEFYNSEEFAQQMRAEIVRQTQEENAWAAYYSQHID